MLHREGSRAERRAVREAILRALEDLSVITGIRDTARAAWASSLPSTARPPAPRSWNVTYSGSEEHGLVQAINTAKRRTLRGGHSRRVSGTNRTGYGLR